MQTQTKMPDKADPSNTSCYKGATWQTAQRCPTSLRCLYKGFRATAEAALLWHNMVIDRQMNDAGADADLTRLLLL